jgi:hypothetical protein
MLNTGRYLTRDVLLFYFQPRKQGVKNEKVSIIVPTLSKGKQADHLPKLKILLSEYLPNQSHKNYETLVFCDGPNQMVEEMVKSLNDNRIKVYSTDKTIGKWGHPQTRMGILAATGSFFVRMNDDNKPYKNYLQILANGFDQEIGIVYGRVIYKGDARRVYNSALVNSFLVPGDTEGALRFKNIDCMNYIVRMDLAKKFVNNWNDDFAADWFFIEALLKDGVKAKFIDNIVGEKL